jgi:hypothetical protein
LRSLASSAPRAHSGTRAAWREHGDGTNEETRWLAGKRALEVSQFGPDPFGAGECETPALDPERFPSPFRDQLN